MRVWEPIATSVHEGERMEVWSSVSNDTSDVGRNAKRATRELAWMIWKRFSPSLDQLMSHADKEHAAEIVATFFADFLLDNMDLVRQLEDAFKDPQHISLEPILPELERRAHRFPLAND